LIRCDLIIKYDSALLKDKKNGELLSKIFFGLITQIKTEHIFANFTNKMGSLMTKHKDIQNPENFSEKDYKRFEYLLFAEDTSPEILEEIVMTLAHLPTKEAQDLLQRFNESDNAHKVEWLEPAMDEGKALYIWPETDQESYDLMALKLYHKKEDHIIDLMGECERLDYQIKQYEIELKALKVVQKESRSKEKKEDLGYRIGALTDLITIHESKLEEIKNDIETEEKVSKKIKQNIKTKRYKNLSASDISGFHFDGEDW